MSLSARILIATGLIVSITVVEAVVLAVLIFLDENVGIWAFIAMGSGALALSAAWIALGPGDVRRRLAYSLLLAVMHELPIVVACSIAASRVLTRGLVVGMWLLCPLYLGLFVFPFYLLRHSANWRIVPLHREIVATEDRLRFSVRQLFGLTAGIGGVLVVTQMGMNLMTTGQISHAVSTSTAHHWFVLAICSVMLTGYAALLGLPALWCALTRRAVVWVPSFAASVVALTLVLGLVLSYLSKPDDPLLWFSRAYSAVGPLGIGFVVSFVWGSVALRLAGYRLLTGKRKSEET